MLHYLSNSVLLLTLAVALCCGLYPLALWSTGRIFFPAHANGSLVFGDDGKPVGSRLIAQPFTRDEYFQPRPSAESYNAAASASSSLATSNYALRDRVARTLGPSYADSPKSGQRVFPDVERWFAEDHYQNSRISWRNGQTSMRPSRKAGSRRTLPMVLMWTDGRNNILTLWPNSLETIRPCRNRTRLIWRWSSSRVFPG